MNNHFCPYCGAKVNEGTRFCPHCGKKITGRTESSGSTQVSHRNKYSQNTTYNDGGGYNYGQPMEKVPINHPLCSMPQAFKSFWINYANFSGYAYRSEFWFNILWNFIIAFVLGLLCFIIIGIPLIIIWGIAIIIPSLSLFARRARDAGVSNGWIIALIILNFIPLIDFFSGIACFIIELMPSVRFRLIRDVY